MQTLDFAEMLERYLDDPYQYQLMSQGFSSVINLIQFVMRILMIIGMWLMFEKAGEHGWGSIIPIYRGYLLFKTAGIKNWFWGSFVASLVYAICLIVSMVYFFVYLIAGIFGQMDDFTEGVTGLMGILFVIGCIAGLICFIINIYRGIKMSQAFNLSGGWAVGIILLPWLFYMIMGCSKNIHHRRYPNGVPKPTPGVQPGYQQNPYGQNQYQQNPYGQNQYQQNPYGQNQYQQNPYGQNQYQQNPDGQNQYQQNPYAQNTAQADQSAPLNPYANNPYMQNQAAQAQPSQSAQSPYASTPDSSQNPYQNPPKQEVWNTIYDENKNNL
ncbi:MAG: hypothetical protein J6Y89_02235 [Lachnospiraceae bacterium]|nr:hypothetical protein [Lachnospiraceae bacterium]